jgi:L-amino acid N-acyltransferase YncA
MDLSFQSEPWSAVVDDFRRLWPTQWTEMALDQEAIAYDPDWERYAELDRLGYLKIVTARDGKKLVGWHMSTVSSHPHYKSSLFAMQDLYYVLPEYRRMPTVGMRLFMAMEDEMRRLGVKEMVGNTKVHLDRSPLFEHLGWEKTAICYRKVLR